ncbi:gluconate 2-dehydrogenase gamma chain [Duganella sp. 1224]|uniref:gluconate 2-dehydrogenase subunit 3 family protein n=1 Tax=Duganella sp. 1224 TaxID=2587052 RepID=UPI0015CCDC70|nr:gluconate 2-dehydrogenase subunit 3 family protein [Duganella sp. 1224]NYE62790.1 gluconate 2-dehydrogenase gamma chain [Duganella sp. 1224]
MSDNRDQQPRRDFLLRSLAGAVGASAASLPLAASAAPAAAPAPDAPPGYLWLRPDEQVFVEALVNHMCPADGLTPDGVTLGLAVFYDRALGGNWGQGDRLYLQGPFKQGSANQGYQLGMTPAQLFRAGTEGLADYCRATHGKPFDRLSPAEREALLKGLQSGQVALPNGVPSATYFAQLLQMFYEAMFADPIYGGNQGKQGWKLVGYPGVNTANKLNIVKYANKPYRPEPAGIADLS